MLLNTIQSPTVHDWYNLDSGRPLRDLPIDWKYKLTFGLVPSCERQLPLLWGEEVFALVLGLPLTVTDDMSASYGKITIPICATNWEPDGRPGRRHPVSHRAQRRQGGLDAVRVSHHRRRGDFPAGPELAQPRRRYRQ